MTSGTNDDLRRRQAEELFGLGLARRALEVVEGRTGAPLSGDFVPLAGCSRSAGAESFFILLRSGYRSHVVEVGRRDSLGEVTLFVPFTSEDFAIVGRLVAELLAAGLSDLEVEGLQ